MRLLSPFVRKFTLHLALKMTEESRYLEYGEGEVIVLLHGLFGALSNFEGVIKHFSQKYKVLFPMLPLYTSSLLDSTVSGMVDFVANLILEKNYTKVHLVGNSLGGHIGLVYALRNLEKVSSITLTGSSGLFENSLGDGYPNKESYEYVKKKTEYTFYNPEMASKELVDEVYETVNNRAKAIRVICLAKSALRHNLRTELSKIDIPVNLIWGKNDNITPLFVGEEFQKLLPLAQLNVIDKCGHAAMMEHPNEFNAILESFLTSLKKTEIQ
ncbi:MAG: alpha/beta hydrolase [Chitinophagales bacterium]